MAVLEEGGGGKALPKVNPDLVNEQEYHTSRFIQVKKDGRQPDYFVPRNSLSFIALLSLTQFQLSYKISHIPFKRNNVMGLQKNF